MKLGKYESKQPSEIRKSNGLLIVNMGPSGAGKTTLLETLYLSHNRKDRPDYTPLCVLDVDGKAHVLKDNPLLAVYPAYDWPTLDEQMQELEKQSKSPTYKTVCIDGVALLQVNSQRHSGVFDTTNPQVRMSKYGNSNIDMITLGERCRVLAERGINVIMNLWSVPEKDEDTNITRYVSDLSPSLQTKLLGQLDFIVHLEPNAPPKPYPPLMRTGGSNKWATKTAVSPDSPLINLPDKIVGPSYTKIIDAFHGYPYV